MTLYDFVQLSQVEKATIVCEGRFLGCKEEKDQTVVLYKVFDFFCEVYFDNIRNTILRLKPFRTKELLQAFFSYQMN